ncbi:MAG: hypothetical protein IJT04_06895 [Bacteroidales bacterium]|nr:hypothetical protein [Bacteroidales bacterium]
MKKIVLVICVIILGMGYFQAHAQQTANVGIEITKKIGKDSKKAELEKAVVSNDVMKDGKVVIAAGTPVVLDIQSEKRRGLGQPETIKVKPVSTTDVNGHVVPLNGAEKSDIGKNRHGAAVTCGVIFGIITFPVGLLFLCIKGGHASIPAGTQMVATAVLN